MDLNDSPAREFDQYNLNETVFERLELLNYEEEFVKEMDSFKTIPRTYFVKSTNPGEQFFLFTNLAIWLMKKGGEAGLQYPQEFDDPNATISTILAVLKAEEIPVDYSISAIKKGSGPACLHILAELGALALKKLNFGFTRFEVIEGNAEDEGGDDEEAELGENAELTAEQFDEDDSGSVIDEDVGEATQFDTVFDEGTLLSLDSNADKRLDYLVANDTQILQFRNEIERAVPQLKITIRSDAKDWRSHIDQMNKQLQSIKNNFLLAKPFLLETQKEIIDSTQRIEARERHINQQLSSLLGQYRTIQDRIAEKSQQYQEASGGITTRSETLQTLGEEVEQLKLQIEEQGARNNDAAPIIRIKQAISKLETQIISMNIQTAVIEQTIFNRKLRSSTNGVHYGNEF
uniref:Intraflagellar transport protein 57 homolog n=1 Tax=Panagrolaimus davidi TaxID=227884 RepID=A0A914QYM0_9BILA